MGCPKIKEVEVMYKARIVKAFTDRKHNVSVNVGDIVDVLNFDEKSKMYSCRKKIQTASGRHVYRYISLYGSKFEKLREKKSGNEVRPQKFENTLGQRYYNTPAGS